nr:uncharacterized protein LOC129454126 [Misgurnus anguillicaudatus]
MDIINTDSASKARNLPEELEALYDANMRRLCQNDLQKKCEEIFIRLATELTYEQCVNLERATKEQANSQDWHKYRIGNPHLGASPDGIASCTCCGKVAVEIKCPYKYRDGLRGSSEDPYFCLDKNGQLKKGHQYYHQVQLHMFVCNVQSCDFVVWTQKEVKITRIARDEEMLQAVLPKAEVFFKQRVLPELLTRSMDTPDPSGSKP